MTRFLTFAVVALLASDAQAQRFRPMDQPKAEAKAAVCTCTKCQCGATIKQNLTVQPAVPAPPVVRPVAAPVVYADPVVSNCPGGVCSVPQTRTVTIRRR